MKKWVKRYIVLGLCFLIAMFPLFAVLNQFDVLKGKNGSVIFFSVLGGTAFLYFGVMTFFMLRHRGDKE